MLESKKYVNLDLVIYFFSAAKIPFSLHTGKNANEIYN